MARSASGISAIFAWRSARPSASVGLPERRFWSFACSCIAAFSSSVQISVDLAFVAFFVSAMVVISRLCVSDVDDAHAREPRARWLLRS